MLNEILFQFLISVAVIATIASGALALGVEWTSIISALLTVLGGLLALGIICSYIESLPWRLRIVRLQEHIRATTARLTNGAVKTFYSSPSRAFIVSMADVIKARYSGDSIPRVTLTAYRSEGVEHLAARWTAVGSSLKPDTVLTFRVDQAFDDRWPDPSIDHAHLPVGDMVDAFVLASLIDDAARGQAPWDAAVADHDEAHKSIA